MITSRVRTLRGCRMNSSSRLYSVVVSSMRRSPRPGLAGVDVELEVREPEHLAGWRGPPPEQRVHARQQLLEVERLDEVVVGAGLEALHAVLDLVTGGEHEDRDVVARLPAVDA